MKNFTDFVVECYLQSEPSVDLRTVKKGDKVDCRKYKLRMEIYDRLVKELAEVLKDEHDFQEVNMACGMWCLDSGPQLVNS